MNLHLYFEILLFVEKHCIHSIERFTTILSYYLKNTKHFPTMFSMNLYTNINVKIGKIVTLVKERICKGRTFEVIRY